MSNGFIAHLTFFACDSKGGNWYPNIVASASQRRPRSRGGTQHWRMLVDLVLHQREPYTYTRQPGIVERSTHREPQDTRVRLCGMWISRLYVL